MSAAWTRIIEPISSRHKLILKAEPEMGTRKPDHESPLLEGKENSSKSFNHPIPAYFQSLHSSDSFLHSFIEQMFIYAR